ncbi:MAG TPA: hypothetical protein VEL75_03815 [Candidatus Methylomirabilis sp.]|nr:hypothetical protein [Candidatus Methylomirabilis sp.]
MLETVLVLLAVVAAGLVAVAGSVPPPRLLFALGLGTLVLGLVLGVPTGLWYHVVLYRCISSRVVLGRTWWLSPSGLHHHLTPAEQRRIRPWYRVGGLGFVLCVAGGAAAIAGLLMW